MSLRRSLLSGLATLALIGGLSKVSASAPTKDSKASVSVDCHRSSGLIHVNIQNDRRIGKVLIEVKDAKGHTLYLEEGKAMTDELVRRLDKGMFPKGAATLTVEAKDFTITESFTIQ